MEMESQKIMMENLPAMLESLNIASNDDLQNSLIFNIELIRVFVKHHKDGELISKLAKEITELYKKARQNPNRMGISTSQLEWLSKLDALFHSAALERINNFNFYNS